MLLEIFILIEAISKIYGKNDCNGMIRYFEGVSSFSESSIFSSSSIGKSVIVC